MCSSKHQPIANDAKGKDSNADSVNIQIIENLVGHQSTIVTILLIIAVVVILHFLWKIYKSHVKVVRRAVVQKSRNNLDDL